MACPWAFAPERIDHEAPGRGVLDESLVEPRLERVGFLDDRRHVVGDHNPEHAAEKDPRRLEASHNRLGRLAEGQPHEAVPGVTGGEDQRPHHSLSTRRRVRDQAHPAEVDLQLGTRLTVGDPHHGPASRAADLQHLERVPVQRPLGHHDPPATKELMGLHHIQPVVNQPGLQLVMIGPQRRPSGAMAVRAMGAYALTQPADQLLSELGLIGVLDHTAHLRHRDIAADRLSVHQRQPLDRTEPFAPHPQTQDLSDLMHSNLPEAHRHLPRPLVGQVATPTSAAPALVDAPGWSLLLAGDTRRG